MPTYTVTHSNFKLQTKTKVQIAKGITRVHNLVTGANTYFAQVIFNKTKNNDHYMGGKKVREPQLFLHGQIRSGRSGKIKKKLILWNKFLKKNRISSSEACIAFIKKNIKNYNVVIGINNIEQLKQVYNCISSKKGHNLNFNRLNVKNEKIINPSRW